MKKVLYILAELEDSDVEWMSAHGRRDTLAAGDALIRQGIGTDSLFFVLDGRFGVSVDDARIATVGVGEILGEVSFIDDHPPTATVTALDRCRVLAIPRSVVQAKLASDHGFAARFYRALAVFLADRYRGVLMHNSGGGTEAFDELDLDRLDKVSRAGERFERVLRALS